MCTQTSVRAVLYGASSGEATTLLARRASEGHRSALACASGNEQLNGFGSLRFPAVATTLNPDDPTLPGTVVMRYSLACLAIVCGVSTARAGGAPSVAEARQRLLHGNYAEARALYEKLAQDPQHKVTATVGILQAYLSEGEYDKAV